MESDEPVLGRIGHYFVPDDAPVPLNGTCITAIVTEVIVNEQRTLVTVAAFPPGERMRPLKAVFDAPASDNISFHYTRDCPWGR